MTKFELNKILVKFDKLVQQGYHGENCYNLIDCLEEAIECVTGSYDYDELIELCNIKD